jgi:hypothetical protein
MPILGLPVLILAYHRTTPLIGSSCGYPGQRLGIWYALIHLSECRSFMSATYMPGTGIPGWMSMILKFVKST